MYQFFCNAFISSIMTTFHLGLLRASCNLLGIDIEENCFANILHERDKQCESI